MKFLVSIAAFAAFAMTSEASNQYRQYYKDAPDSLDEDDRTDRDIISYEFEGNELWWCKNGAEAFDDYCHGVDDAQKYADYRNANGVCDYEDIPA